jgi:hypothetical protein
MLQTSGSWQARRSHKSFAMDEGRNERALKALVTRYPCISSMHCLVNRGRDMADSHRR